MKKELLGLFMQSLPFAATAVFLHFQAVRIIFLILAGGIISFLTFFTSHMNGYSHWLLPPVFKIRDLKFIIISSNLSTIFHN